jgi:hypothetical protein
MILRGLLIGGAAFLLTANPAPADPACSKLAWPLDKERALLLGATRTLASGATLEHFQDAAVTLGLKPAAEAKLPVTPAKPADPAKFSGFVSLPSEPPGDVIVSLSSEGWIDLVQNGTPLVSTAHTGDDNCPGLRKAVRFTLSGAALILEISNAPADHIAVAITPAPKP